MKEEIFPWLIAASVFLHIQLNYFIKKLALSVKIWHFPNNLLANVVVFAAGGHFCVNYIK